MSEQTTTYSPDAYKKLQNPNFWTGLGHGLAGLVGFGELYDVAGDLTKASNEAQQNLQTTISSLTARAILNQTDLDKQLLEYIRTNNSVLNETMDQYNSVSQNNFIQNNIFMKIFALLMFIYLIFMLAK
jgi:predicted PurR-regulated permease PerM